MTDWPNYLKPNERKRLAIIDEKRAALKAERDRLMNLAKVRKHRAS